MRKKILEKIYFPYSKFKTYSKRKKIIVITAIGIGLIIIITQIQSRFKDNGYVTETVKRGNITETVVETGNIESVGKTDVYSPATGVVVDVYVKNGDQVTRGQELFRVRSTATKQEQQSAYSSYLTAKSALDTALSTAHTLRSGMYSEWKDFRDLATNSTYETEDGKPKEDDRLNSEFQSAQDDWLAAESKYKNQQTAISQAQAYVNSTWLLYEATQDATVLALSDGTISNLAVGPGDSVKAYSGTNVAFSAVSAAPSPSVSIINSSSYTAKISLNEADINKIKPFQSVDIEVDAYRTEKYKGVVLRVDDIGTNTNGVIKYNTYVDILNPNSKLKYGMTVDADIKTNEVKNVLTVSNSAVKPYKGGKAVRILNKKNEIEFAPVKVGIKGQSRTEIISGLIEGQEIIASLKNEQVKRKGMFGF